MWDKSKPYVACLLGYVMLINILLIAKQQNVVSLLTVPGIGFLSVISKSLVFRMSDLLGVFFYTVVALLTAIFLFIPMIFYGIFRQRRWLVLQLVILVFAMVLFFFK